MWGFANAVHLSVQVNYDEKTGKGKDDASDYSAQSEESGEESGEEDMPASKVLPLAASQHPYQAAHHHVLLCYRIDHRLSRHSAPEGVAMCTPCAADGSYHDPVLICVSDGIHALCST